MSSTVLFDYWRSTASYRVRIALNLAKISYTRRVVNLLDGAQRSDEHLSMNPQGLVPVLEIDGVRLTQSVAILEYLNTTRDMGLLPDDAVMSAKVRAMAQVIAADIHPVCNLRVVNYVTTESGGKITKEQWMHQFIANGLHEIEQLIDGSTFCVGNSLSLADLCLVPQIYNAQRWGIDLSPFTKISAVNAHLSQISEFVKAHPDEVKSSDG
ncbi:MAG: maleylacetoacetate isomerase [Betaproteobacteria bacterium]